MWVTKKRFKVLEKRVADLEEQVQSQQKFITPRIVVNGVTEQMVKELSEIIDSSIHGTA